MQTVHINVVMMEYQKVLEIVSYSHTSKPHLSLLYRSAAYATYKIKYPQNMIHTQIQAKHMTQIVNVMYVVGATQKNFKWLAIRCYRHHTYIKQTDFDVEHIDLFIIGHYFFISSFVCRFSFLLLHLLPSLSAAALCIDTVGRNKCFKWADRRLLMCITARLSHCVQSDAWICKTYEWHFQKDQDNIKVVRAAQRSAI